MNNSTTDEKCLWTTRIQDTLTQNYYCIRCFITNFFGQPSLEQNPIIIANLETLHFIVKGPYETYNCFNCNQSCTKVQPINNCSLCVAKYFDLVDNLGRQGIDVTNAQFQYDIITETLTKFHTTV